MLTHAFTGDVMLGRLVNVRPGISQPEAVWGGVLPHIAPQHGLQRRLTASHALERFQKAWEKDRQPAARFADFEAALVRELRLRRAQSRHGTSRRAAT